MIIPQVLNEDTKAQRRSSMIWRGSIQVWLHLNHTLGFRVPCRSVVMPAILSWPPHLILSALALSQPKMGTFWSFACCTELWQHTQPCSWHRHDKYASQYEFAWIHTCVHLFIQLIFRGTCYVLSILLKTEDVGKNKADAPTLLSKRLQSYWCNQHEPHKVVIIMFIIYIEQLADALMQGIKLYKSLTWSS